MDEFPPGLRVIKDPRRIRHIGHTVYSVFGRDLQCFKDIQIRLFDIRQPLIIRDISQYIGVNIVRIIDIPPYADDVRVVLPDKSGTHDRTRVIRRTDRPVGVVMGRVELLFHLVKIRSSFRLVLEYLNLRHSAVPS